MAEFSTEAQLSFSDSSLKGARKQLERELGGVSIGVETGGTTARRMNSDSGGGLGMGAASTAVGTHLSGMSGSLEDTLALDEERNTVLSELLEATERSSGGGGGGGGGGGIITGVLSAAGLTGVLGSVGVSALIATGATITAGALIAAGATITASALITDGASVEASDLIVGGAAITAGALIASTATVSSSALVASAATIAPAALVSAAAVVPAAALIAGAATITAGVLISDSAVVTAGALIGSAAVIGVGSVIGSPAIIAAGALVAAGATISAADLIAEKFFPNGESYDQEESKTSLGTEGAEEQRERQEDASSGEFDSPTGRDALVEGGLSDEEQSIVDQYSDDPQPQVSSNTSNQDSGSTSSNTARENTSQPAQLNYSPTINADISSLERKITQDLSEFRRRLDDLERALDNR